MLWGKQVVIQKQYYLSHSHDMHELSVLVSGKGKTNIDNREYQYKPGRMFFFPGGIKHGSPTIESKKIILQFVCFDRNHFSSKGQYELHEMVKKIEKEKYHSSGDDRQQVKDNLQVMDRLINELENPVPFSTEMAESLLAHLLVNYCRSLRLSMFNENTYKLDKFKNLCNRINQDPLSAYPLKTAAKTAGMSRTSFMVHFKNFTGTSYIDYINQAKIKKAMKLFETTNAQVSEVALEVGFNNLGHFHTMFKKFCHMSPGGFKRMSDKNGPFPVINKVY